MYRDFSAKSKQNLLGLVSQVENEKLCDFTDWVGDRWFDFTSWIGQLNIRNYINNVNTYHKKVIDKNNATKEEIEKIFATVESVDNSYKNVFTPIRTSLKQWQTFIGQMSNIVSPQNGRFDAEYIAKTLGETYTKIQESQVQIALNSMRYENDGFVEYDLDAIKEYLRMNPESISDSEKKALLQIINEVSDLNATHTTVMSMGDEDAAAYIGYLSGYSDVEETYYNFISAGAYYNDTYIKILNAIYESGQDVTTFSAQLLSYCGEDITAEVLGVDYSRELKRFLNTIPVSSSASFIAYLAALKTQNAELYLDKVTISEEASASADVKIKDTFKKKQEQLFNSSRVYDPETGTFRELSDQEIKTYKDKILKEKAKLGGVSADVGIERSILAGELSGETDFARGSVSAKVGTASADASIGAGLYVYDQAGNKLIAPSVAATVGVSVAALIVEGSGSVDLFDDYVGLYGKGNVDVAEASADASAKFTVFDEKGNLDIQGGIEASAEANLVEASGSAGVKVLGADVGVSGSVKVGVGAHAKAGYVDGHLKVDVGVALGVGASLGFDIDVGGIVDGIGTMAADCWSDISNRASDLWKGFTSWW